MCYRYALLTSAKVSAMLLVIAMTACSAAITPTNTAVPTNTPLPTNTAVPTNTPLPTNTPVPTNTPTPSPTPLPVFHSNMQGMTIRFLCIEILPSPEQPETGALSVSVDDLVSVFGMAGIAVQKSGGNCEARMRIELSEHPISAQYGSQTCYTGARVRGEVTLASPGAEDLRVLIDEHISPPLMVTECPTSPADAPVKTASIKGLLEAFSKIWSYDFLTALIRSQEWWNPFVRLAFWECSDRAIAGKEAVVGCLRAAATARSPYLIQVLADLRYLGPVAQPAVPELISLLEVTANTTPQFGDLFGDFDVSAEAAETLKVITGQDFGADAARWREWWESQP